MRRRALLGGSLKNIEKAVIPIDLSQLDDAGSYKVQFNVSTRSGLLQIDFGDGTVINYTRQNEDYTISNIKAQHNYLTKYVGNITLIFLKGVADCYSIGLTAGGVTNYTKFKILDFGDWISQFPNLYSVVIDRYNYQTPRGDRISGNLAKLPKSVKKIGTGAVELAAPKPYFDFDELPIDSELEWIKSDYTGTSSFGNIVVLGDLANAPESLKYLTLRFDTSALRYTQGKVWASSFDTLFISNSNQLTTQEVDDILNDLADSVTVAEGDKLIRIEIATRSDASDSAVSYLEGLGFSVEIATFFEPNSEICYLPFDGDILDASGSGFDFRMTTGAENYDTGRNGKQCFKFSSHRIKSINALALGSDSVTIAFWFNSNGETISNMYFCDSHTSNTNNSFNIQQSTHVNNSYIGIYDRNASGGLNRGYGKPAINDSNWHHCVFVIDRSQNGANQNAIYIDGVLDYTSVTATDNDGEWNIMFFTIGGGGDQLRDLKGLMQDFHMYNYAFDSTDVSDLYNAEL